MGIYNFGNFVPAGKADTPNFVGAEQVDARSEAEAEARSAALRNQVLSGGVMGYNELMGDRTPIGDYVGGHLDNMFGAEALPGTEDAALVANNAIPESVAPAALTGGTDTMGAIGTAEAAFPAAAAPVAELGALTGGAGSLGAVAGGAGAGALPAAVAPAVAGAGAVAPAALATGGLAAAPFLIAALSGMFG